VVAGALVVVGGTVVVVVVDGLVVVEAAGAMVVVVASTVVAGATVVVGGGAVVGSDVGAVAVATGSVVDPSLPHAGRTSSNPAASPNLITIRFVINAAWGSPRPDGHS